MSNKHVQKLISKFETLATEHKGKESYEDFLAKRIGSLKATANKLTQVPEPVTNLESTLNQRLQKESELDDVPDLVENFEAQAQQKQEVEISPKTEKEEKHQKCEHCSKDYMPVPTYDCLRKLLGVREAALLYAVYHQLKFPCNRSKWTPEELVRTEEVKKLCRSKYPWIFELNFFSVGGIRFNN